MTNDMENDLTPPQRFAEVFTRLPEQDIEQFYAHYQLWLLRRRVPILAGQIAALQAHVEENQRLIASLQPSAVALAVLARLQSNGVSNVELLDQMLERGEDWLDRMMQRLDYCEQVEDFIQGDYTQWCLNSLEGAYDWIDTMFGSAKETEQVQESATTEAEDQATEELLLRKLRQDDEEDTSDSTLKQPAITHEQAQVEVPEILPQTAEQFLMAGTDEGEEVTERTDEPEIEEPPALLATWTDLEAPPERPAPWYSVNLAEDAPNGTAHPEDMNDWIEMLQADTAHTLVPQETATTADDSSEVVQPASAGPATAEAGEEMPAIPQPASTPESIPTDIEPQMVEKALEAPRELSHPEQAEAEIAAIPQPADESTASLEMDTLDHTTEAAPAPTEGETPPAGTREAAASELTADETEATPAELTVSQEELTPETETAFVAEPGEDAPEPVSHEKESEQLTATDENEAASMQSPANPTHNTPDLASDAVLQDEDATLPMALREIQRAQEAQFQAEAAELIQIEPASECAAPAEVVARNEPAKIEIDASLDAEEYELETQATIEEYEAPRTQPEASEPTPLSQVAPVAQSDPEPSIPAIQPALPQPQSAETPKRRGFWQRLFGWMRRE